MNLQNIEKKIQKISWALNSTWNKTLSPYIFIKLCQQSYWVSLLVKLKKSVSTPIFKVWFGCLLGWLIGVNTFKRSNLCLNDQAYNCLIHFSSCIIVMHNASCIMHHASCIMHHASFIMHHASCIMPLLSKVGGWNLVCWLFSQI